MSKKAMRTPRTREELERGWAATRGQSPLEVKCGALLACAEEVVELVVRKSADYGGFNIEVVGERGIALRCLDKTSRLMSLLEGQPPENEPVEDTWRDLAGYALIALARRRGVVW